MQQHPRVEAGALAARGAEQGEVETIAQTIGRQPRGRGDALAVRGEPGSGIEIVDTQFAQGPIEGGHLLPGALPVPVLVAVEHGLTRGGAQQLRRPPEDGGHRRVVWQDEGGEDFRQRGEAAPGVHREQRDRLPLRVQLHALLEHGQPQPAGDRLRERSQHIRQQGQLQRTGAEHPAVVEGRQREVERGGEGRFGGDAQGERPPRRPLVAQKQILNDRQGVLLKGVVDRPVVREAEGERRGGRWVCRGERPGGGRHRWGTVDDRPAPLKGGNIPGRRQGILRDDGSERIGAGRAAVRPDTRVARRTVPLPT